MSFEEDAPYTEIQDRPELCPGCGQKCDWWMGRDSFKCNAVPTHFECIDGAQQSWDSSDCGQQSHYLWTGPISTLCDSEYDIILSDILEKAFQYYYVDGGLDMWRRVEWNPKLRLWIPILQIWNDGDVVATYRGKPFEYVKDAIDATEEIDLRVRSRFDLLVRAYKTMSKRSLSFQTNFKPGEN